MAASVDTGHQFQCGICKSYLNKPVKTPCHHVFCQECLAKSLDTQLTCPICRAALGIDNVIPAQDVEQQMRNRTVQCTDCYQKFRAIRGREHEANCPGAARSEGLGLRPHINRFVFPCAYCGEQNLSRESLLDHCNRLHAQAPNHGLVCTICVAYPWGDPNQKSGHLLQHLNLRHQFDYDRYVLLDEEEDASLRNAIRESGW